MPEMIAAQSAATHSGRFSPQRMMRSPWRTPAAARRDASARAARPTSSYDRETGLNPSSYTRNSPRVAARSVKTSTSDARGIGAC